jgi:hypothetical protein
MFLKPIIILLAIGLAGWALARARPRVEVATAIMTVFAAIIAHSAMQYAFIDGRLDQVLGDPRTDADPIVVVLIAAGEAVGFWLPILVLPWAQFGARIWGALYALATAALAAVYFYFPFDLVVVSEELMAPDGPPYLLAAIICLPIAGIGYLLGRMSTLATPDEF